MKKILPVILMLTSFVLASCDERKGPTTKKPTTTTTTTGDGSSTTTGDESSNLQTVTLSGSQFKVIQSGSLKNDQSAVSGSGSILSSKKASGIQTNHHFSANIQLAEGAALKLHTFANDSLQRGVDIGFSVSGGKLKLTVGGKDFSAKVSSMPATDALNIGIDVHNEEENPHILVWVNASSKTPETALINSEDDGLSLQRGADTGWGFTLENASISSADMASPVFVE